MSRLRLATMVEDASINHMTVNTGGKGKDALRRFYRDDFIPSWPDDLEIVPVNRVIGEGQLVVVAQFRDDKLACERIYWDHASVLRQVRLLNA